MEENLYHTGRINKVLEILINEKKAFYKDIDFKDAEGYEAEAEAILEYLIANHSKEIEVANLRAEIENEAYCG